MQFLPLSLSKENRISRFISHEATLYCEKYMPRICIAAHTGRSHAMYARARIDRKNTLRISNVRVRFESGRSSHLSALQLPVHLFWLPVIRKHNEKQSSAYNYNKV